MTLRVLGGDAFDTVRHNYAEVPSNMYALLTESVKQISQEINFKSVLNDCDSYARAVEQSDRSTIAFWTESLSAQNAIADINDAVSKINTVNSVLTHLYSLCQSAISSSELGTDYAKEIRLVAGSLNCDYNSKIVNLFALKRNKRSHPEWSSEALQLDKIDISTPENAFISLDIISSAISVLSYSKYRAEQMLANKQRIVRELSIARENISAAASFVPSQEFLCAGREYLLFRNQNNEETGHYSNAYKILLGGGDE